MDPLFLIVDLFCGFGGTSTGFSEAEISGGKIAKVIACVNHDPKAIKSHWLNHPDVKHFEEDIRTLDLAELMKIVNYGKKRYPNAYLILWASLECTNFSKAKGGQPRDADSRTLAEHLFRYQKALQPDFIQIENVVEFMSWGPLDANGKPVSRKNGEDWMKWRNEMCSYGYRDDWKELNSADFGAYTSRNRLFGCFAKEGLPIVWPIPTHSKKASLGMFGHLKKWMPVKEVLNFEDEGESIFSRKKPLSDKTLERIYAGLVKYIAKGDTAFISKYFSGRPAGKVASIESPAGTVKTVGNQCLVLPEFLVQRNGGEPKSKLVDINGPARTLTTTGGNHELVQPEFLAAYYGNGDNVSSIESPAPTIPTKDRVALIQPEYFIDQQYGRSKPKSVESPVGTVTNTPKFNLVDVEPFLMPTAYDNTPKSIDAPAPTLTASRRHHYLVNPSHGGHTTSTENPCPVIIARQDKAPLYLVQCEKGPVQIAVYDNDSEISIRIKQFMVLYNLVDIKMRMLRVSELLKIQGFPADYQMVGNQSDHKKFIGNSVHPMVPKAWAEAMAGKLIDLQKHKAA